MNSIILSTINNDAIAFDEKLSFAASWLKERRTILEQIKAQRDSLSSDISTMESDEEAFKSWLRENMDITGVSKITGPGIIVTAKSGSEAVNITNESALDEKWFRVKKEVDKAAIKKAIKAGEFVDGAEIMPGKTSIQIELF